jgi:hypothetical protein
VVEFCTLLVADDHIRTNLNLLVEVTSEVNILGVLGNLSRRKQPARRIFATRTIRPQARTMLLEDVVEVGVELEWIFLLSLQVRLIFLVESPDVVFKVFGFLCFPWLAVTDDGTPQA